MSTPATHSKNVVQKLTFIDICLERASMATEGPWVSNRTNNYICTLKPPINDFTDEIGNTRNKLDAKFIAHARTDVPELARRLKRACEELREYHKKCVDSGYLNALADELERMPEEK